MDEGINSNNGISTLLHRHMCANKSMNNPQTLKNKYFVIEKPSHNKQARCINAFLSVSFYALDKTYILINNKTTE
jgi:hypothetical protein